MSNIFLLISNKYIKFGVKVWSVNQEVEFWRNVFNDTGTNRLKQLFKGTRYIYVIDTTLLCKHHWRLAIWRIKLRISEEYKVITEVTRK